MKWQNDTPLDFRGEHYQFTRLQPFFNPGPIEYPEIPVLLGAIGPKMTALVGRVADAMITHPTNSSPRFLREVTRPAIEAGAKTRWSAILHGIWLVLSVAALPWLLEAIPVSSLAAILVYIGYKLVNPAVPRRLWAHDRGELAIYLVTVVAIVATNLLEGLLIGIALSFLKLAWSISRLEVRSEDGEDGRIDLHLSGSGTFVGLPIMARALEAVEGGRDVHIHLEDVDYVDHACFEMLSDWRNEYESRGGSVTVEWDTLAKRSVYRGRAA